MKNQRDKLHQYQRRITILTARETSIARQLLASGDKPRALLALRRKKYQESLLEKTDAQLEQLEKLTASVEFAQVQKDVVFGLEQGTNVLKEIHKEMGGLEHVEMLMGDTADAIAYQQVSLVMEGVRGGEYVNVILQEVSDMLGGRISNQDEDEVEDELEAMEAEFREAERLPVPPTKDPEVELPEAPTTVPDRVPVKERAKARQREQEQRTAMLA